MKLLYLCCLFTAALAGKVYKDSFTGDEMFSDAYEMNLVDEVLYEVQGSFIPIKHAGGVQTDDANLSSPNADEATTEEDGIDIVFNHHLEQTSFADRKAYYTYLRGYMIRILDKLKTNSPDQVDVFNKNITKAIKRIMDRTRFQDLLFLTGKSMDPEGMVAIIEYQNVDGEEIPVLYAFKHGLDEESV